MNTETINLDKDISTVCVTAKSFPDGVIAAYDELTKVVPDAKSRKIFGLSRPEKGMITYKAAAEEKNPQEAKDLHLEEIIIKKGKYISSIIKDYMKNITAFGKTFQELLTTPNLDPEGYCVEWYFNENDVRCMVRVLQ
ncbi:MAG: transcriptional regulator [Bacteroidetes bacterium]|nr:MAG: transcriptional regulator [Bacteroidota bacterium]